MPVLYGSRRSRASRNLWLQEEAGFPMDLHLVWQAYRLKDPEAPDAPMNTHSAAFRAIWPMGGIPVLEDGGLVLGESLAINLHLARAYGGDLGPRDAGELALMEQWALFAATAVEAHSLAIQKARDLPEGDAARGSAVAAALAALARPIGALEAHLGARAWMVGDRFTVADINMAEVVRYGQAEPGMLAGAPAVARWLGACQARPAFRRMWAAREAEPQDL